MAFYKLQIKAHNATAHHILKNEVDLILPTFYEDGKIRGIFSAIITGFIGLAFEGVSSFLHHKRHNTLHKAVKATSISMDAQRNKLMHLENTLVMYRIYNAKTLENLVETVHALHSRQTLYEGFLEILDLVKEALIKTNPEYDIVIKRLHLYYDMKLVTFGIDRKRDLII